jgi:hypothetical protein
MTTQTTTITGQTQQGRLRWAAGALAALALATCIATWQMRGREGAEPAASVPATREASGSATVVAGGQSPTVYVVVASADDVPAARARLVDLNRLREANGAPALDTTIVVAESDAAAARLQLAVSGLASIRAAEGLPPIQLIDQRAVGALVWAPAMTSGCDLDTRTAAC